MNSSMAAQFIQLYDDFDHSKHRDKVIEGKRYASNEKQSYLLVKNIKNKEENIIFQSTLDDDYNHFKERQQTGITTDHFKKLERKPAKFQFLTEQNAQRKRLASESSDEMSVRCSKDEHKDKTNVSSTIKPDPVEFMSSSSDESGNEQSDIIPQQNDDGATQEPIVKQRENADLTNESQLISSLERENKVIQASKIVHEKTIPFEICNTDRSIITIKDKEEIEPVKEDVNLFDIPSSPVLVKSPTKEDEDEENNLLANKMVKSPGLNSPTYSALVSPKEDEISPPILSPAPKNEQREALNLVRIVEIP